MPPSPHDRSVPETRQYAGLDFNTAWWLIGNQSALPVSDTDISTNTRPMMVRFDHDNPPKEIELDTGFWIFLNSPDGALEMDTAVIDQSVSSVLKMVTTGMTNDPANVAKVQEIVENCCKFYGFKLLAQNEMPNALQGYKTVFAVVREADSPWLRHDDTAGTVASAPQCLPFYHRHEASLTGYLPIDKARKTRLI